MQLDSASTTPANGLSGGQVPLTAAKAQGAGLHGDPFAVTSYRLHRQLRRRLDLASSKESVVKFRHIFPPFLIYRLNWVEQIAVQTQFSCRCRDLLVRG